MIIEIVLNIIREKITIEYDMPDHLNEKGERGDSN
jgi:hypothetical protein